MSLVRDLTPINLLEEKQKFFDQNCKYNPYFKYNNLATLDKLYKYGQPKPKYLALAQEILNKAFHNQTEADIRALEGKLLNRAQAQIMIDKFLTANDLNKLIKIVWSDKFLGKASYYKNVLKLQLPLWHRRAEFKGTLYHELGTHAIRRINYAHQPFFKKKNKFGFEDYMRTEEGLAGLHTLLARNFKLDYTGALNYVTSAVAQKKSFTETFNFVLKYIDDRNRAWRYTVKHKRGLYDTAKSGGFTKDIVYFEGMIKVWQFMQQSDFDLEGLYLGKIAYEDIAKAREMNPGFVPQLPSFIRKNKSKYIKEINKIAQINKLDQILST